MSAISITKKLGQVFVNNKIIKSNETITIGDIRIDVTDVEVNITVEGNVNGEISTMSGDVTIKGNVDGDVETMSGNIYANDITGDVETMSGDIRAKSINN